MSGTYPPAVQARLSIAGREDVPRPRFWCQDGIRLLLTLTDAESGAPVLGASGVSITVDRPGAADDAFAQPGTPEIRPGVFALDLLLEEAGAWEIRATVLSPRCGAARLLFDVIA
jgi:hypothetical protein